MGCEICGVDLSQKVIAGISICDKCFDRLVMLRNGNGTILDFYNNPANLRNASESAKEYLNKIVSDKLQEKMTKEEIEEKKNKEQAKIINFMSTTGYNFEGYKIKEYLGIESGQIVLGTGFFSELDASLSDLFGTSSNKYTSKIEEAREFVLKQLCAKCMTKGANAVIGVDIDIMTIANNMIVVCANGTAVVIEKEE